MRVDDVKPFEEVDRPVPYGRYDHLTDAFLATVETGKAIRVPLNGKDLQNFRTLLSRIAREHGCRSHVRKDGDEAFIAWAEKK